MGKKRRKKKRLVSNKNHLTSKKNKKATNHNSEHPKKNSSLSTEPHTFDSSPIRHRIFQPWIYRIAIGCFLSCIVMWAGPLNFIEATLIALILGFFAFLSLQPIKNLLIELDIYLLHIVSLSPISTNIKKPSRKHHIARHVAYFFAYTWPMVGFFIYTNYAPVLELLFSTLTSNTTFIALFITWFLYYAFLLFNFRKNLFVIYSLLWISIPITSALAYFGPSIWLIKPETATILTAYAVIAGLFASTVEVLVYIDSKVNKYSRFGVFWTRLVYFLEWRFFADAIKAKQNSRNQIEKP